MQTTHLPLAAVSRVRTVHGRDGPCICSITLILSVVTGIEVPYSRAEALLKYKKTKPTKWSYLAIQLDVKIREEKSSRRQ
jgi:hypothetical protein